MAFYRVSLTNLRPEPPYHLSRNIKIRVYPGKQPRSDHLRQQNFSTKTRFNTTSFLYERTSILSMIQPPLYIYNTYSAIHIIPCTAKPFYIGKPTLEILFISGAQFSKKDRSSKKWKNLFIIFKTLLSRFAPMLNLVIHPSFLLHTAYTLMVDFYIFALSLKNTPKARRPIIQDMHIGCA